MKIAIVAILLLLGLFALQTCRLQKKGEIITSLQLDKQTLEETINTQNRTILTQEVIISSSTDAISSLTDTIFQLKKKEQKLLSTIAYYKETTQTRIDSVVIPYLDTIAMKQFSDSILSSCKEVVNYMNTHTITIPRVVYKEDIHYTFAGTINKDSFIIDSLSIYDTLQLRFVEKKGSLFRKPTTHIQFFHSNPHITTTQANSVLYKPPKKPRLLEKALIFGAGIFLGSKL